MKFYEILNAVAFVAFVLFAFGLAELLSFGNADLGVAISCGVVAVACRVVAMQLEKDNK